MSKKIAGCLLFLFILAAMVPVSQSYAADSQGRDLSKFFTANDYFDFEWISDPRISPCGKKIVYVRNFADILSDQFYSNLWIVDFDGKENRPLTSGLSHDGSPRWSPDGSMIVYISDKDGKPQMYKRWMDTEQTVMLTNLLFPPSGVSWSSDGKWIAFSAPVPSMPRTIAQLPPVPPGARWAPPATIIDKTIYRFDGIGYQISKGYTQVFVMPSEGGTPRQITHGNFHHPYGAFGDAGLSWTPDNKHIILSANRRQDWELNTMDTELYEVGVADGKIRALTDRRGGDGSPVV
ncbi:MAG: PD40 domain-containing protein, partial [Candidatus Aminicenantes bacterium]|nr:PD40 domain-containing protein [Candidatus Aminicenantes bacterium]